MCDSRMTWLTTPVDADLGLTRVNNQTGLEISLLPNGAIFAIEHQLPERRIMINQVLASSAGGLARIHLRTGGPDPGFARIVGPNSRVRVGTAGDRIVWDGEANGLHHRVTVWLHPSRNLWFWRVEVDNQNHIVIPCDAIFVQDLGLGERNFLMNNEAFASQYLDHHIAEHPRMGPVIMGRQNLSQAGAHPWVAHGCLERAAGFATDFRQVMGPGYRDSIDMDCPFGTDLATSRLQHECACAALQSPARDLAPGGRAVWNFFGFYQPDHPKESDDGDLVLLEAALRESRAFVSKRVRLESPVRSLVEDAPPMAVRPLNDQEISARYPLRTHIESVDGEVLSFFTPDETHSRHVVLRDKERIVSRRHGAMIRSGRDILPSDKALCATCWMHGIFAAQLTLGNTSLHKLFSVSRDPYNMMRASGLRILADLGEGWRLLAIPSAFEMGLWDCRWIYRLDDRTITISAMTAGDEPAMQWRVVVDGPACRFLVLGHLALGERELDRPGRIEIDSARKRFTFRPAEGLLWTNRYPHAVYHLVTSTPESIEAIGSDDLLYRDRSPRAGAFATMRTHPTNEVCFAVVGSLESESEADDLADKYATRVEDEVMQIPSSRFWRELTRGFRLKNDQHDADVEAINTVVPWLVHDALIHLSVPHGLEQYNNGAWGTRDVCQGPVELLLSLQHDEPVRAILRIVFAQQYEHQGDWPQWFMLDPYSVVQERQAHGDVIVWPLKALCDYVEETGDFAFLDEPVSWRRESDLEPTSHADPIRVHLDRLLAAVQSRFVAGTHLIRYGNGDWNDSLQPVDPSKRDWMVSSWTVALLYQQLRRYAEILRRTARQHEAEELEHLAARIRNDFDRYLIRDNTVAGYGIFDADGRPPDLLLHPSDVTTGISCSLISMTRAIIGGLFTPEQTQHHLSLIREHLCFPDGARLMDRPIAYRGGIETLFRRAESAAFFGREIGLMYVHSHLRYAEAMAVLGDGEALWEALAIVNPIAATERLSNASLRQRNTYFSSSDAAFRDRYQASTEWNRVKAGTIPVDGGWRVHSSGPGLYMNMLIRHALGVRRRFGEPVVAPCLPPHLAGLSPEWTQGSQ